MYKLKFSKNKLPLHQLPFVNKEGHKRYGISFWGVPRTGGYIGGRITGEALATIYLQYLLQNGQGDGGLLQLIATDMLGLDYSDKNDSVLGQASAFFFELEKQLMLAVKMNSDNLIKHSPDELLKRANAGLNSAGIF